MDSALSLPTAPLATVSESWAELLRLARDESGDRQLLSRLLDLWCHETGAVGAALYVSRAGALQQEVTTGDIAAPERVEPGAPPPGLRLVSLAKGVAILAAGSIGGSGGSGTSGSLGGTEPSGAALAIALAARGCLLRHQLKEQSFQVNFRGVELEALYDVGLAVAATLDLEQLSEEILLRAASLLDARRGALYLLADGQYRLDSTFGGEAAAAFAAADPSLAGFLAGEAMAPPELLPGARHLLGVPIEIDHSPRGLLAVGDKESRRGVGPFPPGDRRTLALFANQAAIALENARLHRQALEKERLEREMHLAAEIQRQILPKGSPDVPGFDLAGWNRSARQVGGDYYDLMPLPQGTVGLAVGDVSGKGMPAALLVSTLHSGLRLLRDHIDHAPELLERLNRHLLESSASNKFVTMLIGELTPETGAFTYVNAGHNPGLLLRRDGGVETLDACGLPLGLLPNSRYHSKTVEVAPGDLLCLYSDGITECATPADEEFGMARLQALLAEHRDRPLPQVIDEIDREMGRWSAGTPQGDDQTLVLLRRHP